MKTTSPVSTGIWQRKAYLNEIIPIRVHERWALLSTLVPHKILEAHLPDPATRPVLLAGVLEELSDHIGHISGMTEGSLASFFAQHSIIVQILQKPYMPVFMSDVLEKFQYAAKHVKREDLREWYLREVLQPLPALNSTLRNLLLAVVLNETIFSDSSLKARVALAQYSWKEIRAKIAHGEMPDLLLGTEDKLYVKFMVAIIDANGHILEYADYGQSKGQEKYDQQSTGEGLGNIAGEPSAHLIDPLDLKEVIRGMRDIQDSQNEPEDREAVRRLDLHMRLKKEMVDAMETEAMRKFPRIISSTHDLTSEQMSFVFRWASLVKEMWDGKFDMEKKISIGETGTIYPKFRGRLGLIRMDQPSTRTLIAASEALRALGMVSEVQYIPESSLTKGEGRISDNTTLMTHDISVILARYSGFEDDAARLLAKEKDVLPTRISLGGNTHHPTQTLAEALVFLDYFKCTSYTLEELANVTHEQPPTIAFIGHTKRKRADKALINFITTHLPHWNIKVIVPKKEYLPPLPSSEHIQKIVSDKLNDPVEVSRLVEDCTFLYVSNQEATSGSEGVGDGLKTPDYHVSVNVLDKNPHLRILHPLPASAELDEKIFQHDRSLISDQMQNKIAIITALIACQLEAIEERGNQINARKTS